MDICYVTSNQKKFDEACHVLYQNEADKQLYRIRHAFIHLDEIQGTPQEIAKHKAKEAYSKLRAPVIIDDVSVHFPAIGGMPGPYIRSFLEALGDNGLYTLISHYADHTCYVTCTIGFLENEHTEPHIFQSTMKGTIVAPRGTLTHHGKTSWNRIIQPDGFDTTVAELTLEEISRISPRGAAIGQLKEFLREKGKNR